MDSVIVGVLLILQTAKGIIPDGEQLTWLWYFMECYSWSQLSNLSGPVELHAVNPAPDGCISAFRFFCLCRHLPGNSEVVVKTHHGLANGGWTSYCFGGRFKLAVHGMLQDHAELANLLRLIQTDQQAM